MQYTRRLLLFSGLIAHLGACGSVKDPGPTGATALIVRPNPHVNEPAFADFKSYAEVFGLRVYAEAGLTDAQVLHVVTVLAELIDNDEDGKVDDPAVVDALQTAGFIMPMFTSETSSAMRTFERNYTGNGVSAVLFADEVDPTQPGVWGMDATVEELIHTINHRGHVSVYPYAFGISPGTSALTEAMDVARGGQFLSVPTQYPKEAWYHYDDRTCDYECMAIEYLYWVLVTNMGLLDTPRICEGIANEWEPCSKSQLQSIDTRAYTLIHNTAYTVPMRAPDGTYRLGSTP